MLFSKKPDINFVWIISLIICFGTSKGFAQITRQHGAHVHGSGKLTLAMESPTHITMEFDVPGESIIGFEHEATSAKDHKTKKEALEKVKTNIGSFVQFDPSLQCIVKHNKTTLKAEAHDADDGDDDHDEHEHHGVHQDITIEFEATCQKSTDGTQARVGIIKLFPRVKKIMVQLLGESKQKSKEITTEDGSIDL